MSQMYPPPPQRSAPFILAGLIAGLIGMIVNSIGSYMIFEAIDSYYSYSRYPRVSDGGGILLLLGTIAMLTGAVLFIIGLYRAFKTFDAVAMRQLFGPTQPHAGAGVPPQAWQRTEGGPQFPPGSHGPEATNRFEPEG